MTAASEDVILLDDTLTETFLTDLQSRGPHRGNAEMLPQQPRQAVRLSARTQAEP